MVIMTNNPLSSRKSNKIGMIKREEYRKFRSLVLTMTPKRKWWNVPSAKLYNISPRMTHSMTTVLLMKAQNPMPMQELLLVERSQLEESVDLNEAPKAHPMATNQAFLSKLMQSSHLSDITLFLQLVGQFNQPLAPKETVKL